MWNLFVRLMCKSNGEMTMKHTKSFGWAWFSPTIGLCHWAEPNKAKLTREGKPSPEAIPVRVELVPTREAIRKQVRGYDR